MAILLEPSTSVADEAQFGAPIKLTPVELADVEIDARYEAARADLDMASS